MRHFYFDLWPANNLTGAATGELTQAFDRNIRDADQAVGQGSFKINRHDSQAAWVVPRALIRVRLVTGGPFAYNDARYKFAFFIESSSDVALTAEEEGGEVLSRGGRSIVSILQRALIYPNANISGHRTFWRYAKETGEVVIPNRTIGEAFRILLLNAQQRTGVLAGLTIDFTNANDSTGTPWPDTTTDWKFPVGMDLLSVLSKLSSSQTYFRITPGLLLSCYENHPGVDHSATVIFAKGDNLTDASEKQIEAQGIMSRALVKGTKKNNRLTFAQAVDTAVEAAVGRIEGFVEYKSTPTEARLLRAGRQAITKSKLQHDGPTTSGVLEETGAAPYVDYLPGDSVTVNIPSVYTAEVVKVAAIILKEVDNGEYDPDLEFNDSPFDPMTGPDNFSSSDDGTKGSAAGCGDCPATAPPPFVDTGQAIANYRLAVGSTSFGYPTIPDNEHDWITEHGGSLVTLVPGEQYRFVLRTFYNRPIPFDGNFPATGANANYDSMSGYGIDIWKGIEGAGGIAYNWLDPVTLVGANPFPISYPFATQLNRAGAYYASPWRVYDGSVGDQIDYQIEGTPMSGFWGYEWIADLTLEHRVDSNDEGAVPGTGQPVTEAIVGDGTTTAFTTNYPYAPGSLTVLVCGVPVTPTETNPATGAFTLSPAPALGCEIIVRYLGVNGEATGATNGTPAPGNLSSGVVRSWKEPVLVATTANVNLSTLDAGDTLDGVVVQEGARVLVKDQSTASQNGIYRIRTALAALRAEDFDSSAEIPGAFVYVISGTANAGRVYRNTNTGAPTIGTTAITFSEFGASSSLDYGEVGDISASAVGDTAAAGTTLEVADAGHRHAREGFGSVVAATAFGQASANGTATTVSHSDHSHGVPAMPQPLVESDGAGSFVFVFEANGEVIWE